MEPKQYVKIAKMLYKNDLSWYAVVYSDGDTKLMHETSLSNILQCGQDMADFGIDAMYRCGARNRKEAEEWLGEM